MATFLTQTRRKLTRALHRLIDVSEILTFSCCPLKSWSTKLQLEATTAAATTTTTATTTRGGSQSQPINLLIDQWTSLGSGGFVWNGARRLAKHLQKHGTGTGLVAGATTSAVSTIASSPSSSSTTSPSWAGLNVIELGAGTGCSGLVAAALGANVTLTDQAAFVFPGSIDNMKVLEKDKRSLLDLLRTNVQLNQQFLTRVVPGQKAVQICEMLWGSDSHHAALPHATFDVVLASDVLLFTPAHKQLLSTLTRLSTADTVILIEHSDRSDKNGDEYPRDMLAFLKLVAKANEESGNDGLHWDVQVIKDYGRHITLRITRRLGGGKAGNADSLGVAKRSLEPLI